MLISFGLMIVLVAVVASGCPPRGAQPAPTPGDGQQREDIDISALVGQWVDSGHANILLLPAQRDGCVVCHDGGAFAGQLTEQAAIERDFFIAIDCRACHSGRGQEVMEAGTVSIPTAESVQAGTGAQCLACHNERRQPDIADENRSAPHYSSQAGVYTATGGIRVEGFDYGSTTAHAQVDNTCVRCHMTGGTQDFASHTFRVDDVQAACGQCHENIETANLQAKEDYDGNGEMTGFQQEVAGLLDILEEAIVEALDGGSIELGGGKIQFKDASGETIQVEDEVYLAAYNHTLVSQDGSLGVHNPLFSVQLLQQSHKALTGEDVPGATMR
jgi:hypothetical protein